MHFFFLILGRVTAAGERATGFAIGRSAGRGGTGGVHVQPQAAARLAQTQGGRLQLISFSSETANLTLDLDFCS